MPSETFEAAVYGSCKLEIYTKKGYIRQRLEGGNYGYIIGCSTGRFADVCRALVKPVKLGKSKDELVRIRESLMTQFEGEDVS